MFKWIDKLKSYRSTKSLELEELTDIQELLDDMKMLVQKVDKLTSNVETLEQDVLFMKQRQTLYDAR